MRYIGVDLHKTNFVVCFLTADETTHTAAYPLTKTGMARFITQLEAEDQVAVEVTANIYYFYDQVKPHVARVVLVDIYQFAYHRTHRRIIVGSRVAPLEGRLGLFQDDDSR